MASSPAGRGGALVLAPFDAQALEDLRRLLPVTYESWLETRTLHDPEELGRRLGREGFTVLVVEADFVFEELFQAAPGLRLVAVCRGSTGHVDLEAATRHGVAVVHTPGRNARAVAEHVLALMLTLARGIHRAHHYVVQGRWRDPVEPYASMRGLELGERTLGIVGLGAIGRTLARLALALDMRVLGYDPHVDRAPQGVEMVPLEELLRRSDFVSLHVPHTPETEGLLDAGRLALMRPTAYLVNATGAAVVDQEALAQALASGRLAGAAVDVFEAHPVPPENPLLGLDNVVLTPHIGGATVETVRRHSRMVVEDVGRFLEGRRPLRLANPEVWPA